MGSKVEMQMPMTNGQSVIQWINNEGKEKNMEKEKSEKSYGPAKSQVYDVEEADEVMTMTYFGMYNESFSRLPQGSHKEVVRAVVSAA